MKINRQQCRNVLLDRDLLQGSRNIWLYTSWFGCMGLQRWTVCISEPDEIHPWKQNSDAATEWRHRLRRHVSWRHRWTKNI